jgi:hypothetical protein
VSNGSVRMRWLHIGVILALLLSVMPRVINLAHRPLDNFEAVHALNAAQLTPSPAPYWSNQEASNSSSPMYAWLTGLVFQFVGSGEAEARVVPALAGLLLAILPIFCFGALDRLQLLLASVFIALSPVAVTLSRTAGDETLGALFLSGFVLTVCLPGQQIRTERRWIWAAVLLGAALASGVAVFNGLFSILLAYLLFRWMSPEVIRSESFKEGARSFLKYSWLTPVSAVVMATGVGIYRFGLAGLGESIALWMNGWVPFGQLSALGFLVAGVSYEPFILLMGIIGVIVVWRSGSQTGKLFSLWALGAFLTGIIYPGRSAQDWIWAVIPLSFLAAEAIGALLLRLERRDQWIHVIALISIALVLTSAAIITLIGYVNGFIQQMLLGEELLIGVALLAMLVLLVSVFVLFGLGWSWDVVWDGLGIFLGIITMMLSVSAAWNLANDGGLGFRTLWVSNSPTENVEYFSSTIENASLALTGKATGAPVFIQGEPDPALIWQLRAHPPYVASDAQNAAIPPILIVPEGAGLGAYGAEYFGQDFVLNLERGWFGMLPPDLLRWSLTHSAPTAATGWVVFIRADIIGLSEFSVEPSMDLLDGN